MVYKKVALVLLGIVCLFAVVFFLFGATHTGSKIVRFGSQMNGPECSSGAIFTTIPINPQKILSVTPLGNLNPPDHTIPTDHIYLVVKNNNEIHPEFATAVFAPADITISTITHTVSMKNGKEFSNDYSLDFFPCKDVQGKFGHMTKLSPKLTQVTQSNQGNCQTQHPRPEDEYTYCRFDLNTKVSAGEQLGEAGGGTPTSLDFWAIDFRSKELVFANKSRYTPYQLHTACPVDLFEQSKKDTLSLKFGMYEKKRTIEPLCGRIDQDVIGTAQGNWTTAQGYIDMPEAWSKSISLIHDNVDPTVGILSIGGIITSPAKIQFVPLTSGTINREFSQVTDNQIYCYEGQSIGFNSQSRGRVLIQLINSSNLKVEYQNSSCQNNFQFTNPTTYHR